MEEAIKEIVNGVVRENWDAFSKSHPELAGELSKEEYVGAVLHSLRFDPAYRAAMRNGEIAAQVAESVTGIANRVAKVVMNI